ncbi:MAG TPA: hypothetical protein VKG61_18795, partial [Streptosporangiaceae bacterium]|nr:hypothetical protein [Streptosporangiaceae bacterium]
EHQSRCVTIAGHGRSARSADLDGCPFSADHEDGYPNPGVPAAPTGSEHLRRVRFGCADGSGLATELTVSVVQGSRQQGFTGLLRELIGAVVGSVTPVTARVGLTYLPTRR